MRLNWMTAGLGLMPLVRCQNSTAPLMKSPDQVTSGGTTSTTFVISTKTTATSATSVDTSIPTPSIMNPDYVCKRTYHEPSDAEDIWYDLGVGLQLDTWIKMQTDNGDRWFEKLIDFAFDGESNMDCSTFGNTKCTLDSDACEVLTKKGKGQFYWIINAVVIFNNAVSTIHEDIQDSTIFAGLDIATIFNDFNVETIFVPETSPSVLAMFGSSFLVSGGSLSLGLGAATALGLTAWSFVSPIFAVISLVGSIFGLANALAAEYNTVETETYIDNQIKVAYYDLDQYNTVVREGFNVTQTGLRNSLLDVLGYGNIDNIDKWYTNVLTETDTWDTSVAQFFAGGKWLISDLGTSLAPLYQTATESMTQKLAMMAMMQSGVWLIDSPWTTQELCDATAANGGYGDNGVAYYPEFDMVNPTTNMWDVCDVAPGGTATGSCLFFATDPGLNGTNDVKIQNSYGTEIDNYYLKQPLAAMNLITEKYGFPEDGWGIVYNQSVTCQGTVPPDNTAGSALALTMADCFWNLTMNYTSWNLIDSFSDADTDC